MRADQVASFYLDMEAHHIRLWVMGGWGIDALLGGQSRDHHDLDVLVEIASLELLWLRLHDLGFELRYVWDDETWWVRHSSWERSETLPTAFVYGSPDGREVDVHVVRVERDPPGVMTLWRSPYAIARAGLEGRGSVGGCVVRCLTAEMQLVAHTGYELPAHHLADLRLLMGREIANPS